MFGFVVGGSKPFTTEGTEEHRGSSTSALLAQGHARNGYGTARPCWTDSRGGCRYMNLNGGSGPTRAADAGRGAGALDALLGWKFLCGEVPE